MRASMGTVAALVLAACLVGGCASTTRVDYGGVMHPRELPGNAIQCSDQAWRSVDRVRPDVPGNLILLRLMRQDASASNSLWFAFDVDEAGSPVNIRFVRPEAYMRHATMREVILASAQALEQWRFQANGNPVFATGCETQFDFNYTMEYRP